MKRILRSAGVLLVISALFTPAAQAYLTVTGNGAAGQTFASAVTKGVFFRPTGEYYFGLTANATAVQSNYSICYGAYRTAGTAPVLTALGTNIPTAANQIDHLAIVPNAALATSPTIVYTPVAAVANTGTGFTLEAISKTATTPVAPSAAQYAAAATGLGSTTGALSSGVRALSFSRSSTLGAGLVFAAVKVGGVAGACPFGAGANAAGGAGTNTDGINAALLSQTAGVPAFTYVGAAGINTATAVPLAAVGGPYAATVTGVTDVQGLNPAFCYDEQLSCLYVGIQGQVAAGSIIGVGVYPVTPTATTVTVGAATVATGIGHLNAIAANSIICSTGENGVGVTNIFKLKTMHTSTGMAYLIVNGNSTDSAGITTTLQGQQVANQIWAVPLVNPGAPAGIVGSFANVHSGGHVLQAAAAGDLVTTGSLAAQVGGSGILPVAFGQSAGGVGAVNDIYVDGDAVYVATGTQAVGATISNATETGLWKSQAVFNDLGQIDHWTDWQKVVPNDMGGNVPAVPTTTGNDPRLDFAAVDSYTGHVWAINNTNLTANVTQWTQPTGSATNQALLASAVNSALGKACYSVLDLNASVTGWGANTPAQITMFGGQEKVCFAVTGSRFTPNSSATLGTYTSLNAVMTDATYDYTQTVTFITTSLPTGAGAVVALGFSGWDADGNGTTQGFFLAGCAGTAGTAPALYAYTPAAGAAATGFNTNTVAANDWAFSSLGLTVSPAGTPGAGNWQKVANVSGMPIKIQGFGGGLHVLTRSATIDCIYSCPKVNTLTLLNSSFVITASSGNVPTAGSPASSLGTVKQIYDFVVSVSAAGNVQPNVAANSGVEQLVMLTNDGIYTTSSLVGMQAPTSQLNAGWVLIDATSSNINTQGYFSNYISYPAYNRMPQTFWLADYAVNPAIANVYNKNIQYQASRHGFAAGDNTLTGAISYTADPTTTATFDGATSFNQTTAPTIYANFPVLYRLFYNDGARRFFIQKNPNDDTKYQVLVLPYNLYDYNITANGKAPQADAVIAQAGAFYWMSPIGDTGRLMMGTSNGVISLQ